MPDVFPSALGKKASTATEKVDLREEDAIINEVTEKAPRMLDGRAKKNADKKERKRIPYVNNHIHM